MRAWEPQSPEPQERVLPRLRAYPQTDHRSPAWAAQPVLAWELRPPAREQQALVLRERLREPQAFQTDRLSLLVARQPAEQAPGRERRPAESWPELALVRVLVRPGPQTDHPSAQARRVEPLVAPQLEVARLAELELARLARARESQPGARRTDRSLPAARAPAAAQLRAAATGQGAQQRAGLLQAVQHHQQMDRSRQAL